MSDVNVLPPKRALEQEQGEILQQLEDWLEIPMLLLSFVWLALLQSFGGYRIFWMWLELPSGFCLFLMSNLR